MFTVWAILAYLAAMAIPVYLLYEFGARHWLWHTLAIVGALVMGFVPTPPEFHTPVFDLLFGFVFIVLMIWGVGGLAAFYTKHEKHA